MKHEQALSVAHIQFNFDHSHPLNKLNWDLHSNSGDCSDIVRHYLMLNGCDVLISLQLKKNKNKKNKTNS